MLEDSRGRACFLAVPDAYKRLDKTGRVCRSGNLDIDEGRILLAAMTVAVEKVALKARPRNRDLDGKRRGHDKEADKMPLDTTRSKPASSSNMMSNVSSNGPAFLLRIRQAMSPSFAIHGPTSI